MSRVGPNQASQLVKRTSPIHMWVLHHALMLKAGQLGSTETLNMDHP